MTYADATISMKLPRATGEQIDNFDFVMEVVASVPGEPDRAFLWAVGRSAVFRHRGPAWSKLARFKRCDRRTVKSHYQVLLVDTAARWNAGR